MTLTTAHLRFDKRCGRSGIPDNRKCRKPTSPSTSVAVPPRPASGSALPGILAAAGLTATAYIALRERYRSGVSAAATDAVRRSRGVDTTIKPRQKRIVFCVPGASGSESIQRGEGIQAAWQKSLSPERNKKDEKTIMVDTRKANLDPRDSADANPQEIMAMHLKNQVRGRNEAAVDLASQIIAFRRAHPDKQIVVVGHSYGGAIAEEALAIVSRTKTKTQGIVNINFGTNNYGLLNDMVKSDVTQVTLGSPNDPFTANGPTKNLRNITTVKGHSLRDYSSDRQVQTFVRNLVEGRAPLMRRDSDPRLDKKCGASGIPDNAKCTKGGSWPQAATIGAALTAGGIAAFALTRGGNNPSAGGPSPDPWDAPFTPRPPRPSSPPRPESPRLLPGDRTTRQLTGLTPRALLPPGRPPKSKTQRMRENTAAATRSAEQAIGRAAQAEITRAGAVANAMASAGEATGMTVKTTLRELRLRTEAARRRFEPGYRAAPAAQRRAPAQLPEGGSAFAVPFNPATAQPPAREAAPLDPRTGQPRRRRARGFGRSDNYIPVYAPVALRGIR